MNIFEWAEEYEGADYYEMSTGRTFLCSQYMRAKRFGLPAPGIYVIEPDGSTSIVFAPETEVKNNKNDVFEWNEHDDEEYDYRAHFSNSAREWFKKHSNMIGKIGSGSSVSIGNIRKAENSWDDTAENVVFEFSDSDREKMEQLGYPGNNKRLLITDIKIGILEDIIGTFSGIIPA